jgi:hypothetical protein
VNRWVPMACGPNVDQARSARSVRSRTVLTPYGWRGCWRWACREEATDQDYCDQHVLWGNRGFFVLGLSGGGHAGPAGDLDSVAVGSPMDQPIFPAMEGPEPGYRLVTCRGCPSP